MKKKMILIISVTAGLMFAAAIAGYLLFLAPVDWRTNVDKASKGVIKETYPWVGAKDPVLEIHEYFDFDCPHCPDTHKKLRGLIARKFDKIRLVRHDYARMRCKPNNAIMKYKSCELVRAAICASKQIDYWKWNDFVIEHPRYKSSKPYDQYVPDIVKELGLSEKPFELCLYESDTVERAQKIYDETKKNHIKGTPSYLVNGAILTFKEVAEKISNL
jgi:protein-disulfide isomerase